MVLENHWDSERALNFLTTRPMGGIVLYRCLIEVAAFCDGTARAAKNFPLTNTLFRDVTRTPHQSVVCSQRAFWRDLLSGRWSFPLTPAARFRIVLQFAILYPFGMLYDTIATHGRKSEHGVHC